MLEEEDRRRWKKIEEVGRAKVVGSFRSIGLCQVSLLGEAPTVAFVPVAVAFQFGKPTLGKREINYIKQPNASNGFENIVSPPFFFFSLKMFESLLTPELSF